MSTPPDGDQPWHQPGQAPPGSGYGQPSSPSYGKYGQGQALPTTPPQSPPGQYPPGQYPPVQYPPGQSNWGQQPGWGQPGYGPPQPWTGGPTVLQPVSGTAVLLVSLTSALYGLGVWLVALLTPNQNQGLRDFFHAAENSSANADPPSLALAAGSVGYRIAEPVAILAEVAVWVVTCLWLTRARQNALVLNPRGQRRSEAWVWLGWVIPIVNFWFPKMMLDDTLAAAAAAVGERRPRTGLWWTAWILMLVVAAVQAIGSALPPNQGLHLGLAAVQAVVVVTGLTLWIRIVRWISSTQNVLAAQRAGTTTLNG